MFFKSALVLYLGASLVYLVFLLRSAGNHAPLAFWLTVVAFATHSLSILHRAVFSGFLPLATHFDVLSFFAWILVGIFLAIRYREPSPVIGCIVAPLASSLLLIAATMSHQIKEPIVPVLKSWWLPIHVLFAVVGNAVFAMMAVAGLLYLLQERLIKNKRIGRLHRLLPSLATLDTINRHGLPIGFFLLTIGIISGALWAGSVWGSYWTWDPKETWSLITWFAYAAMVHQRVVLAWRGRRAAIFALVGFGLVMFTFIGVNTLIGGHHAFQGAPRFQGPGGI